MPTHAILIEYRSGIRAKQCRAIILWVDGTLEWAGRILHENYTDSDKVSQLMDIGNLSTLGRTLEECHPAPTHLTWQNRPHTAREYLTWEQAYQEENADEFGANGYVFIGHRWMQLKEVTIIDLESINPPKEGNNE